MDWRGTLAGLDAISPTGKSGEAGPSFSQFEFGFERETHELGSFLSREIKSAREERKKSISRVRARGGI